MDKAAAGALYRRTLALGDQLFALLQSAPGEHELDQIEQLLEQREALVAEAAAAVEAGVAEKDAVAELSRVLEQHRILQAHMARVMTTMQGEAQGAVASRSRMEGMQQILRPEARSRMLNQRK